MSEDVKMSADLKNRWVEALRSGKYKQAQHSMRTGQNEFCCLGVLCDIVDPEGWVGGPDEDGEYVHYLSDAAFPLDPRKDFGLLVAQAQHLAEANDGGDSFAEIADWIEANL